MVDDVGCTDNGAAQNGGDSSRRLYSYLSGSDNDDGHEEAVRGGGGHQRGWRGGHAAVDWRGGGRHRGADRDDEDGLSSPPSWVHSASASDSDDDGDVDADARQGIVGGGGGGRICDAGAFSVYSRINDSGL